MQDPHRLLLVRSPEKALSTLETVAEFDAAGLKVATHVDHPLRVTERLAPLCRPSQREYQLAVQVRRWMRHYVRMPPGRRTTAPSLLDAASSPLSFVLLVHIVGTN